MLLLLLRPVLLILLLLILLLLLRLVLRVTQILVRRWRMRYNRLDERVRIESHGHCGHLGWTGVPIDWLRTFYFASMAQRRISRLTVTVRG